MTKPQLALQTDRGRYYANRNHPGVRLISVTTALKVLDKPALVPWAAKMVAEEAMATLPALVKASRSRQQRLAAIAQLKGSPYAKKDAAADLGSAIHAAAEAHVLGKPHTVADDVRPFLDNYLAFIADFGVEFEATEATVAHPEAGYAGTGDIWARLPRLDDALWLLDIKTSSTRPVDSVYPEYAYQLAALRHAPTLWLPDHSEIPAPQVDRCAVLNIRADGYALVPVRETAVERAYEVFLACVRIASLQKELDKVMFEDTARLAPVVAVPA